MAKLLEVLDVFRNFIASLTFMDLLFLTAMLILIILMIILIYYIKVNQVDSNNITVEEKKVPTNNDAVNNQIANNVVNSINSDYDDEEGELMDLETLTKYIKDKNEDNSSYNAYELEQEQKAIISYDELLKKANQNAVQYLDNGNNFVRKIDIDKINVPQQQVQTISLNKNVALVSYAEEEAFLEALKKLQSQLIN